jgi:two-component system osmolarity sensor histidine kinase EnvZ
VRLLPQTLFGRLALLLLGVLSIAVAATIVFFGQDRAALLARQFGDTKIVQLQAIRAALAAADGPARRDTLFEIGREYGVRLIPENERTMMMGPGMRPFNPAVDELEQRLREALGPGTEVRPAPGRGLVLVRIEAAGTGYWVGFPMPPRPATTDVPTRAAMSSLALAAALLIAAFVFARYLSRPLRVLNDAVDRVGRGEMPPPLPEDGPSEIARLNRGFNRMAANLQRVEEDRALLLAGVSHDLRTPLARLRIGIEMGAADEAMRAGMIDDIEEMNRIIGQFLEFARTDRDGARESCDANALVGGCVERYARVGRDVRFAPGSLPPAVLRPTAFSRLVANLVDNALAYGAPPVEVTTRAEDGRLVVDVADRGPGIPPAEVERLKQPFTRASAARTNAGGAGLGLAIVDRIARMHGGTFDLLPRDGGGTIARVALPLAA